MKQEELKHKIFWKYFFRKGRFINFKNPKLFTEKIQWLKVYDCLPIKTTLADKLAVRDWVKDKIGEEYLKQIYAVASCYEDINFREMQKEFVIKTNHGCNMQKMIIEGAVAFPSLKTIFNNFLNINYAYKSGYEMQYDKIPPKIFVEEYIKNTNELFEYLFFCFNGEPKFVMFSSDKRTDKIKSTMFDMEWNNLGFNYGNYLHNEPVECPKNFDKMVDIARILSKDFKFVRVDLHNIDGKIYFGEMTFYHNGGMVAFDPYEMDVEMGKKFVMMKYIKKFVKMEFSKVKKKQM